MNEKKEIINITNYSQVQKETIIALLQSCEKESINIDKFMIWVLKKYKPGDSFVICLLNSRIP